MSKVGTEKTPERGAKEKKTRKRKRAKKTDAGVETARAGDGAASPQGFDEIMALLERDVGSGDSAALESSDQAPESKRARHRPAGDQPSSAQKPPKSYICRICGVAGHFVTACPAKSKRDAELKKAYRPPCEFWARGSCHKGEACGFSHDAEVPVLSTVCKFFMSNSCLKGDSCSYSHDLKRVPCEFFHLEGKCDRGDRCLFGHAPLTDDDKMFLVDKRQRAKAAAEAAARAVSSSTAKKSIVPKTPVDPPWAKAPLRPGEGSILGHNQRKLFGGRPNDLVDDIAACPPPPEF